MQSKAPHKAKSSNQERIRIVVILGDDLITVPLKVTRATKNIIINTITSVRKIEERNEAKKNKDFATADKIRDELFDQGIKLIDSRDGTTYEIIEG